MPYAHLGRLQSKYQPTFSQGFRQVGDLISNLAILKIQQNFREKEATIQRDLTMGMAGFSKQAPTTQTTTTPAGGKRRVPSEAVQPDIEAGGQEYFYKGFKPRVLGSIQGHSLVEVAPGKTIMVDPTKAQKPIIKEFKVGEKIVTRQFDSTSGKWVDLEEAPRHKPGITINMPAAAERERLATGRASLDSLDNLRRLHNDHFTGPVKGRIGQVKDYFGANPQAQSEFYAATAAFKNQIIKEITGAQMSEKEADRIMKQVPDVDDVPSRWRAKWQQSVKNLERIQQRRLEIMEKAGLKVPDLGTAPNPNDPLGLF